MQSREKIFSGARSFFTRHSLVFFTIATLWTGWGCGVPPTALPCSADAECSPGELCRAGTCEPIETASDGPSTTDAGTDKDGSEETSQDEPGSPTEPQTEPVEIPDQIPAPCAGSPAPTCRTQGLCRSVTPVCEGGQWRCAYPQGYEEQESTCDGVDNDCDGQTDEMIQRSCFGGDTSQRGLGACKEGTQTCNNGQWGACQGEVLSSPEVCDNLDNDCDGKVDETLQRTCFGGDPSQRGIGRCQDGTQTCDSGQWGTCQGEVLSSPEVCDGVDSDCDGKVDEMLQRACFSGATSQRGVGSCKDGAQTCNNGQWGTCQGEVLSSPEVCDNMDNDCDGSVDEMLRRACFSGAASQRGVGRCQDGAQTCSSGQWGACQGEVLPSSETCDNMDNDCDGSVDERVERVCYTGTFGTQGVGTCRAGKQSCTAGQWNSTCQGQITPKFETCDNMDNDCDGNIDEGLTRSCYGGPFGTRGKGSCQDGSQTCRAGSWGRCQGQVLPSNESCNGRDDDCDGMVDDGSLCGTEKVCRIGRCVCDNSKGYYAAPNGTCVKDGQLCPAFLGRDGQICLDSTRMMVCDPFGRVGIINCPQFMGSSCVAYGGIQGCKAPNNMDSTRGHFCQNFIADYNTSRRWSAVVGAYGIPGDAVITFSHCVGAGVTGCGQYVNSFGSAAVCLCGEYSITCNGQRWYDFAYRSSNSCQRNIGANSFGCPSPLSFRRACSKGYTSGFPVYACQ